MEIRAWKFFSFWAATGVVFFYLGFKALETTDLVKSISPTVMSFFKQCLAISACHSFTYALVLRPKLEISVQKYYMWFSIAVFPVLFALITGKSRDWISPINTPVNICFMSYIYLPRTRTFSAKEYLHKAIVLILLCPPLYTFSLGESFAWYFPFYVSNFMIILQLIFAAVLDEQYGLFVHFAAVSWTLIVGRETKYFPVLVLFVSFFSAAAWAAASGDERFQKWLPENRILLSLNKTMKKYGKVIEFAMGMVGAMMFQNFFRLTSFDHVKAFLYLAVAWLANIALLMPSHDFGIFNFLLSNVIVGCTVSQFGLGGTTWVAYGTSVLLYILRMKLESLAFVTRGEGQAGVIVWWDESTELQDVNVIVE